jgi:hypothetical protein
LAPPTWPLLPLELALELKWLACDPLLGDADALLFLLPPLLRPKIRSYFVSPFFMAPVTSRRRKLEINGSSSLKFLNYTHPQRPTDLHPPECFAFSPKSLKSFSHLSRFGE